MLKLVSLLCWCATGTLALTAVPALADEAAAAPVAAAVPVAAAAPAERVNVSAATAEEAGKMVCRTVKVTGSNLRTRRVCTTPTSESRSQDLVRQRQDRGGLDASAIVNKGSN